MMLNSTDAVVNVEGGWERIAWNPKTGICKINAGVDDGVERCNSRR